ncbi:MAG: plasmid pRiA4b ORF-3 family protein [Bacteroidetes bacterium]|nr:plasmid pRiA4b ORF-3 family protein [Bacteroidota bacterium]
MPMPKQVYQLKVTLDDVSPPVWRRLLVSGDTNLLTLHEIIQEAMGWQNYHLHMYTIAGQIYGDPEDDEYDELGTKDETRYRFNQLGLGEKARFKYEYDFGDSWHHTILVEKILQAETGARYPICLAGKNACPPEDVGGVWGYETFLAAIANPKHEEHEHYRAWIGGDFDPKEFNLDKVNERLRGVKPARGRRVFSAEPEGAALGDGMSATQKQMATTKNLQNWLNGLDTELVASFESLPLRRDVLTFLDYLSKNKTIGTQSTGNLPLKAVYAICEGFVNPPKMKEVISSRYTTKVRSEDEVWPLVFVHTLAFQAGLVDGGLTRRWKVTPEGLLFPQLPPPSQVVFLFSYWITACDWAFTYRMAELADGMLTAFKVSALTNLSALSEGQSMPFEPFAERVIAGSRLQWSHPDESYVQTLKHRLVEQVLVDPMTRFGVLECGYRPNEILGGDYKDLETLSLTAPGKSMLTLLKESP